MTMSMQQIFDKVYVHLLTQKKKSKVGKDCAYRGKDGLMCALGCLIPDKYYQPELNTKSTSDLNVRQMLVKSKLIPSGTRTSENFLLMQELQIVHDVYYARSWKYHLKEVATRFGLKIPDVRTPGKQGRRRLPRTMR